MGAAISDSAISAITFSKRSTQRKNFRLQASRFLILSMPTVSTLPPPSDAEGDKPLLVLGLHFLLFPPGRRG